MALGEGDEAIFPLGEEKKMATCVSFQVKIKKKTNKQKTNKQENIKSNDEENK